jgi:effector-binding domain-containing protein
VEVAGPFAQVGAVEPSELPAGTVAVAVHRGPYDQFDATYTALRQWCAAQGLTLAGPRWEVYGDWADDPAALETEIACLVAPQD